MRLIALFSGLLVALMLCSTAYADDGDEAGFVHQTEIQVRATPIGLSAMSNTGYRIPLDYGSGDLFDGLHVDLGLTNSISPSYGWLGPYVEVLPIAVLHLRFSMRAMAYLGTFGNLYVPGDDPQAGEREWTDDALDRAWDEGLGRAATGWMAEALATPQMRVGRVVAMAESGGYWLRMNTGGAYYEPFFDLLFEEEDQMWLTRPTVGYLFGSDLSEGYLLVGARWERAGVFGTDLTRDTAGVVWNWQIPPSIMEWGSPQFAGFGGVFINHPTRSEVAPYLGTTFSLSY